MAYVPTSETTTATPETTIILDGATLLPYDTANPFPVAIISGGSGSGTGSTSGTVVVSAGTITVSNLPATQTVAGTVSVNGTANVSVAGGTLSVGNTVSVSQSGTGTANVSVAGGTLSIGNTPTVSVTGTPTVALSTGGSVSIAGTASVTGTIDLLGHSGSPFDVTIAGGTASLNCLQVGGIFRTTPLDLVTNSYGAAFSIDSAAALYVSTEGLKTTYAASGIITPAATPTSILTVSGSATKTIRIKRIHITSTATTAGNMQMTLNIRTSANSGGTSSAPTIAKLDSNNAAATAVIAQYSANPTSLGTLAYALDNILFPFAVGAAGIPYDRSYGTSNEQGIVLRGAAQYLEIDLNGGTVPSGGQLCYSICWSEE